MNSQILQRLAVLSLPPDAMREVLTIIAEIQASKEASEVRVLARRSKDRARKFRGKSAETVTENPPKEKISNPLPVAKATEPKTAHELQTDLVWQTCPQRLTELGISEKAARSNLGRWLREVGPARTLQAVDSAARISTQDPIAYITAAFKTDRVHKNGTGWVIPHGTEEYTAWRAYCVKSNSPKVYEFPDKPGHEAKAPSRWPK